VVSDTPAATAASDTVKPLLTWFQNSTTTDLNGGTDMTALLDHNQVLL
jgi:hypothetical protein